MSRLRATACVTEHDHRSVVMDCCNPPALLQWACNASEHTPGLEIATWAPSTRDGPSRTSGQRQPEIRYGDDPYLQVLEASNAGTPCDRQEGRFYGFA